MGKNTIVDGELFLDGCNFLLMLGIFAHGKSHHMSLRILIRLKQLVQVLHLNGIHCAIDLRYSFAVSYFVEEGVRVAEQVSLHICLKWLTVLGV